MVVDLSRNISGQGKARNFPSTGHRVEVVILKSLNGPARTTVLNWYTLLLSTSNHFRLFRFQMIFLWEVSFYVSSMGLLPPWSSLRSCIKVVVQNRYYWGLPESSTWSLAHVRFLNSSHWDASLLFHYFVFFIIFLCSFYYFLFVSNSSLSHVGVGSGVSSVMWWVFHRLWCHNFRLLLTRQN